MNCSYNRTQIEHEKSSNLKHDLCKCRQLPQSVIGGLSQNDGYQLCPTEQSNVCAWSRNINFTGLNHRIFKHLWQARLESDLVFEVHDLHLIVHQSGLSLRFMVIQIYGDTDGRHLCFWFHGTPSCRLEAAGLDAAVLEDLSIKVRGLPIWPVCQKYWAQWAPRCNECVEDDTVCGFFLVNIPQCQMPVWMYSPSPPLFWTMHHLSMAAQYLRSISSARSQECNEMRAWATPGLCRWWLWTVRDTVRVIRIQIAPMHPWQVCWWRLFSLSDSVPVRCKCALMIICEENYAETGAVQLSALKTHITSLR